MPKYRALSSEELELMQKEFIAYLIVNGITADEWENMKTQEPNKVNTIVELFSDVVFEKLMRKTKFITKQMNDILTCFFYDEKKATMILVENWCTKVPLHELNPSSLSMGNLKMSKQEKTYDKQRELELYMMIQGGAEISDGTIFNHLLSQMNSNS